MPLCPECHHRPSVRFVPSAGYAQCYCKCHDVADAGPDMYRVMREALTAVQQGKSDLARALMSICLHKIDHDAPRKEPTDA